MSARKWRLLAGSLAVLVPGGFPNAAEVASVSQSFAERAEAGLVRYKNQSAAIADEKIPLIREINALEDANVVMREKIDQFQQLTANNNRNFDALRNRLEELKVQTDFAGRFLGEYLDSFETRIHTAEVQEYNDPLARIRTALDQPTMKLGTRFEQQLAALELGLSRAEQVVGGYQFEGQAIAPGGVLKRGTIAVLGPAAYFSDARQGGTVAGVLQFHTGTMEPAVAVLDAAQSARINTFVQNGRGEIPFDASLGNAISLKGANVRIVDHIARGGPVGYAILVLGAVALVLSLIKLADLGRFRSVDSRTIAEVVRMARARHADAALAEVKKIRGPVGDMLELGVRNITANGVLLEEMMLSVILRKRPEIERYLPFLAITAAAAPLLGLLGTVVGMIRTFALIVVFGSDPASLSGGISEALITTELGLMVAIPTLVIHAVFSRMIRSRFGDMERVAFEFVRGISLENSKGAES